MSASLLSNIQAWDRLAWSSITTKHDVDLLCSTTDSIVQWCDANAPHLAQAIDDYKEAFLGYHRDKGPDRLQETRAKAAGAIRRLKAGNKPAKKKTHERPGVKLTAAEKALHVLSKSPRLSNREIAKRIGCHASLLSRSEQFKKARRSFAGEISKGSKSKDGSIEAWDEE